jgi:O-antigen/teichoic acid export membrane protein
MALSFDVRRVLSRNAAWNYASVIVNIGVNFLLFRYVVSRIGATAGGVWLLLASVTGYFGLLHLGIAPAVPPLLAARLERNDAGSVSRLASTTVAVLAGLGAVPLLLLPLVPALVDLLNIPPSLRAQGVTLFALGFVAAALHLPGQAFNAFLSGAQRGDRCAQLWIVSLSVKAIGTVTVLAIGGGLVSLAVVELVVVVVTDLLTAVTALSGVPGLSLSWRRIDPADVRRIMGFGGVLFVANVCNLLTEQTDRLVIGAFLPVAMVTYYAAAWKLYMVASILPATLLYALAPVAGAIAAGSDIEALRGLTLRMSRYSTALAIALAGAVGFGAAAILDLWLGPTFAARAAVAQILLLGWALTAGNLAVIATLVGTQRVSAIVWRYSVPQAIANLILSLLLVKPLGITGVAMGTMIPALAFQPVFLRVGLRELGVTWSAWMGEVVRPTFWPAVCFAPAVAAVVLLDPSSPVVLVTALASALGYLALFVGRSMPGPERAALLRSWGGASVAPVKSAPR